MTAIRSLIAALGAGLLLSLGLLVPPPVASIAAAAPIAAAPATPALPRRMASRPPVANPSSGSSGPSLPSNPNPLDGLKAMLSPDNLGKLIRDTTAYLLQQLVSGLHDLLLGLTQGDNNVITHTRPA